MKNTKTFRQSDHCNVGEKNLYFPYKQKFVRSTLLKLLDGFLRIRKFPVASRTPFSGIVASQGKEKKLVELRPVN